LLFHHDLSLKTLSVCKDSIKKRKSHSLRLQIAAFIIFYPITLANSQGEVCDEEEAIYYTFGPGKAQKVTDVIKKKKS